MRGGEGIRSHFLLLTGEGEGDGANLDEDIVERRPSLDEGIKLIRPDGYVAYSTKAGSTTNAWRAMRALLELQTA